MTVVGTAVRADAATARRSVLTSLGVNCIETLAMGAAAWVTASVALRAQTAANAADLAVGMFLLIGVLSSARPPDDSHPLGYGRDRFFWSLFAALGIFIGGGGLALEGAVSAALHPTPADHYAIAYVVLLASATLDSVILVVAVRPLRRQARARHVSLPVLFRGSTDPASMTVVVGGGCAVIGACVALAGLIVSQLTGSPTADTVAGALIGVLLLSASAVLLHANRELLVGRGVPLLVLREMRAVVAAQPGIVDVPDLFAVVVGPSSLIVDGDVTFADELDVPAVEQTIIGANAALRARWPTIDFVYLTPVPRARPRRNPRPRSTRSRRGAAASPVAGVGGTDGASWTAADPARGAAPDPVFAALRRFVSRMGGRGDAIEEASLHELDQQEVTGDHDRERPEEGRGERGEAEIVGDRRVGQVRTDDEDADDGAEERAAGPAAPERDPVGADHEDDQRLGREGFDEPSGAEQCRPRPEGTEHQGEGGEIEDRADRSEREHEPSDESDVPV